MDDFRDIRITELDDTASGPAESGPLMNMVLKLSAEAQADWRSSFDETWAKPALAMRRKAVIDGDRLTSTCMTYELQGQIDQLNGIISEVNETYRLALMNAVARQAGDLRDLKANLRYD